MATTYGYATRLNTWKSIRHDPFARVSLYRLTLDKQESTFRACAWCGGSARFVYQYQSDANNRPLTWPTNAKLFCSVGCFDATYQ